MNQVTKMSLFDESESGDDLSDEEQVGQETDNFRWIEDHNFVPSNDYFGNSTSGSPADVISSNPLEADVFETIFDNYLVDHTVEETNIIDL